MSDFLSHLAGRSLGPTNTVRPRFLPIFDPLQPTCAPEWRGPQSSISAAIPPRPFLDLELKASGAEINPNSASLNRPPPAGTPFRSDSSRVAVPVDAAAVSEPERRPSTAEIFAENSRAEHPIPSTNGTRDAPHPVDPSPAQASPISPFKNPLAEKGKLFVPDREEIRMVADELPRETRPAGTNLVAVRSSPARSIASLSFPPPASPQSSPLETASAINVTIGRVEVRATLPPVATQTPRRNAQIVSLDEYLRQRAKGAGR